MNRIASLLLVPALLAAATPKVLSPAATVQRQIERFNAHDLEGYLALFAEDLEVADLPASEWGTRNKAWLRDVYAERFRTNPDLRASTEAQLVSGTFVIETERIRGRVGQAGPLDVVVVYQVKNGKIVRMWELRD
ncbi:MAG: nuclear transport factor 2 family protein [Geothrix sp.]|nr:nuclear transport factor 2 family protein [Geothrix sp.]